MSETRSIGAEQPRDGGKPLLGVSLDLDNLWSYQKTHGDSGWDRFPSYLSALTELLLPRLERLGLRLTVFVVGQDAVLPENRDALRAIAQAGHELGNHSFHHEPWLGRYSPSQVEAEVARAEEAICEATAVPRLQGFRGPGFSISQEVLRVLSRRGYRFDASTFPTFIGPLCRGYYFLKARGLPAEERRNRRELFGTPGDGLRPIRPYVWDVDGRPLLEIPVTTMPVLRLPMHQSYLLYLAGYARFLGRAYQRLAAGICRLFDVQPSLLLHPLDFLGGDRVQDLAFFPGMHLPTAFKLDFFEQVMTHLMTRFEPVPLGRHARILLEGRLPMRSMRDLAPGAPEPGAQTNHNPHQGE